MQTEENYAQLKEITLEAIMKNTTGMNAGPFYDKNKLSY